MIQWRNRVTPALLAVAAAFLLVALFLRPASLPPSAAQYKVALPPVAPAPNRKALPGITYAVDTIESDGLQHPISGAAIKTTNPVIVHGWAVAPDSLTPGQALLVSVDRQPGIADPSYGFSRPDVGAAINPSATKSGFNASVSVKDLKPGVHSIYLTLEDPIGRRIELPTSIRFTLLP